jgi:four helix bundle protein
MGQKHDLKQRTKDFALRVIRLYVALPKSTEAQVMGKQALRSGTSVGAHYREATRARSPAEFLSKNGRRIAGTGRDCVLVRVAR